MINNYYTIDVEELLLSGILNKDMYKKIEEKDDRKRIFFYIIKNG